MRSRYLVVVAALGVFAHTAFATELRGKVSRVNAGQVTIQLEGAGKAQIGNRVLLGIDVPGVGFVQIDGEWQVSSLGSGSTILADPLAGAHGTPKPGYLAEVETGAARSGSNISTPGLSGSGETADSTPALAQPESSLNPFAGSGWEPPAETAHELFDKGHALLWDSQDATSQKQGLEYLQQAAQRGHRDALFEIGVAYTKGRVVAKSNKRAAAYYERAAELGSPPAQFNLGYMYYAGIGVRENDAKALHLLTLAANQGVPRGQSLVGELYQTGRGTQVDPEEAARWYQRAADNDDIAGINNLGVMYRQGWGVERNYTRAIELFRRGAELGDDMAFYNLGYVYEHGIGVAPDREKAVSYYQKATSLGNEEAQARLAELGR